MQVSLKRKWIKSEGRLPSGSENVTFHPEGSRWLPKIWIKTIRGVYIHTERYELITGKVKKRLYTTQ